LATLGIAQAGSVPLTTSQAWLCPRFHNFGCTRQSSSRFGSAHYIASLALPSFAQNLHKIWNLFWILNFGFWAFRFIRVGYVVKTAFSW